ncbi:hypothetical protein BHE74_00018792 [Ensete ventricosum]|nr:hypothetical protein BHE74_00018792 [Ensete ventricosum]RZR95643.1 hypothetical protein BHM03_00024512 [Ensete ventricosum]
MPELPAPRPLPIPLNSTRTEIGAPPRNDPVRTGTPLLDRTDQLIVGGPTSGGDSSLARRAYARSAVEKRLRRSQDPRITFGEGDDVYLDHDDALVISAQIANARVKRVMVDT